MPFEYRPTMAQVLAAVAAAEAWQLECAQLDRDLRGFQRQLFPIFPPLTGVHHVAAPHHVNPAQKARAAAL